MPRKQKRRRGNGEGSLYQRKSDKLWVGSIVTGVDDEGKYIRPQVSGRTQAEVLRKLDELKEKHRKGTLVDRSDVTLRERINHWLEYEIKPNVVDGTYDKYYTNIQNHINPTIGKEQIQKITRSMMVEYLAKKENQLAPETVKILLSILRRVFDIALIDEVISKNPLLRVKRTKKVEKKKRRKLTNEEQIKILVTAKEWKRQKQAYNILFTEYGSGLRRGEILPLKKADINFDTGELIIKREYIMLKGKPKLVDRAKTESSQEPMVLPRTLLEHLNASDRKPDEYLFPAKNGEPINPNGFRKTFKRILKKAGMDESIRLHDLRHNYASQMVALDVHLSNIQAQMRHADAKTTSRYTHTTTDGQRQAAAAMDKHLKSILDATATKLLQNEQKPSG